jgi:hypothetical protein
MATPSAGATSIVPSVSAWPDDVGQHPCFFQSAGTGTACHDFDWLDRSRKYRIPTRRKVFSFADLHEMRRMTTGMPAGARAGGAQVFQPEQE